jgi:hypothetical protein
MLVFVSPFPSSALISLIILCSSGFIVIILWCWHVPLHWQNTYWFYLYCKISDPVTMHDLLNSTFHCAFHAALLLSIFQSFHL